MIDRKVFFDNIRQTIFGGSLQQETVEGCSAILDGWEKRKMSDLRHLAYMLATVRGECGPDMLPVREGFKRSDEEARRYVSSKGYKYAREINGQVYYGRGWVQLTWDYNYKSMGALLNVDLYNNPDLALTPDVAANIMFVGMERGIFTTKKLSDYLNDTTTDWVSARRIINGTDRAEQFANWAVNFHKALSAAEMMTAPPPVVVGPPIAPATPPPVPAPQPGFWEKFAALFKPKV